MLAHQTRIDGTGELEDSVRQGRLAMVDVLIRKIAEAIDGDAAPARERPGGDCGGAGGARSEERRGTVS